MLATAACVPARAADITVAWAAAASSADPHFHAVTPNNTLAYHVFSALTRTDPKGAVGPGLAESWEVKDDRTWVFHLVSTNFQDGTPFTANDVIYSLCRTLKAVGPTQSFVEVPKTVAMAEVIGPHTIVFHTHEPDPTVPALLAGYSVLSAHTAGAAADIRFDPANQCGVPLPPSSDFDNLKMANGTGPYRLTRYVSGDVAVLEANRTYFGAPPHWDRVTIRPVPNTGARTAGLLAGDYDLIENPAAQDLPAIKVKGGLAYTTTPSDRIIFLQPDIGRTPSPLVEAGGKNPLADKRVREAISLAIDRRAIAERLMDGLAVPADQYVTEGLPGHLAAPPKLAFDPARARQLLAEAGYPNGFDLTISATNDRYINDAKVVQALGQFLSRVGIRAKVDAMTQTMFFPRRAKREFSLAMGGWGYSPLSTISVLRTWVVTTDLARGIGGSNYGSYHSEAFDNAFLPALTDLDEPSRDRRLQEATRIALTDNAIIPLYWETSVWAFKDRYTYVGRSDQVTDVDGLSLMAK
ncbi:MAG: ABC transporter substrate-binding protein [Rhodopila sp.]|nr:ABC transporter substrate-binding protein [Rhodopila sp.]